jgi:hypothetical protein
MGADAYAYHGSITHRLRRKNTWGNWKTLYSTAVPAGYRFGVLGLVRSAMAAGGAPPTGQTLTAIVDAIQKNLHRRVYTRAGSNQAMAARERLRDLATELRKMVEAEGPAS